MKVKSGKRSKYKTDEVETMDKVQLLGQAFQKIQTATGIQVHLPLPLATTRTGAAGATVPFSAKRVRMTTSK